MDPGPAAPTTPPARRHEATGRAGRYYTELRAKKDERRDHELEAIATVVGQPSLREVLLAGAVAYWAEGTKRKPWRLAERVTFTNSDPDMVRLFVAFLRAMGVDDQRRVFRVSIHESADDAAARAYWADLVGVPEPELMRSTLKRHIPKTVRKNVGDDYHGCLVIGVRQSVGLYREIEGIWRAISIGASTLMLPSRIV